MGIGITAWPLVGKGTKIPMTNIEFHQLTLVRWPDFEELFGKKGACGGCWCMWWRLTKKEFDSQKGDGNRRAMKRLVDSGRIPGILAYHLSEPIGWCSIAPREDFKRLESSRILKPIDDKPVWSIVCFFIRKQYRRQGVSTQLLQAAIDYVRQKGGRIIEGYAIESRKKAIPDLFAYQGPVRTYLDAGFVEVARRSETRPIMRCFIPER